MKQFIRKAVYIAKMAVVYTIGAASLAFIIYAGYVIYMHNKAQEVSEAETPQTIVDVVEAKIEETKKQVSQPAADPDTVEEARKMLDEATRKLDEEEARLLDEIEQLETRVAEIADVRASF